MNLYNLLDYFIKNNIVIKNMNGIGFLKILAFLRHPFNKEKRTLWLILPIIMLSFKQMGINPKRIKT